MASATARLVMTPATGERLLRFVGDRIRFSLGLADGRPLPTGWLALLRTNLGRASVLRQEIITSRGGERPLTGASWRDIPMKREGDEWLIELSLADVGYFKAKAYAVDEKGWQIWPDGMDVGITVHPDADRTANTIYCAFTRLFGETKTAANTADKQREAQLKALDKLGYAVIPPSGKLRDLINELPHIVDTLGCRILHLLPINPTPTTHARFGRFGSPYASLDLTAIDPALVEFDRRTTGVDQFRELAFAIHAKGARLFLDLVINHTGWMSSLYENHSEWFLRTADGAFVSPGAWGVTWEDLVELDESDPVLWDHLAEAFLTWCRRGVDGFRCDAGYKVPMPVWQYITARVREEFPETIFLLEGLGGGWTETESLLTEGGMQWAYSELFQEFSGVQVAGYLDHALKQSQRVGVLVHYSETHDNERLAKKGRAWSLLRNRLCGLTSFCGGYGFACGVEWLAAERINVHGCAGLAWGSVETINSELARLNRLLAEHPCFFDGAKLIRLSPPDSPVYALLRESAEGTDSALVLVNTDVEKPHSITLDAEDLPSVSDLSAQSVVDLLGQAAPRTKRTVAGGLVFQLESGACFCLSASRQPHGLRGEAYRQARAQAAWALRALSEILEPERIGPHDWRALAELVDRGPERFLGALAYLDSELAATDLLAAVGTAQRHTKYAHVVEWSLIDQRRITPVPPHHWLLIRDRTPFRATLEFGAGHRRHTKSFSAGVDHIASFPPESAVGEAALLLERYAEEHRHVEAAVRFLSSGPTPGTSRERNFSGAAECRPPPRKGPGPELRSAIVLLTNGIGGMARLCVDLGRVQSKYDCLLGANLNPAMPVDRHIFAKRVRVWANIDRFISALDGDSLIDIDPGPPARWKFAANSGDGWTMEIEMSAEMLPGQNTTVLRFRRGQGAFHGEREASDATRRVSSMAARLTVRVDIEDRNFHWETKRHGAVDHHFAAKTKLLEDKPGFAFTAAADRQLHVFSDAGAYHPQPEWCENIPHPVEASRGQVASGDAYSPGWFDLPLAEGQVVTLVVSAESVSPKSESRGLAPVATEPLPRADEFEARLARAALAYVVRRGDGKTVIAGYPWFLDWGRDTLICARGLLAAGMVEEVKQILVTFARFEDRGTLPNTVFGDDASNRDTSDAPLWFGVACEEANAASGDSFHSTVVDQRGRTISDVLESIARHYRSGTPNGIRMDPKSGLIWSPRHFTWMDTNHPACTPREGYPIEIQALWIRLLRQLQERGLRSEAESWGDLAARAEASLQKFFWLEDRGYFADLLIARTGEPASAATVDTALRGNDLFALSLGLVAGERAQRCVDAARRYLVVPGALRSLAPLPVSPPLTIYGADGLPLNDPKNPYRGRYEGDEDTRRKPAYHNGTTWTWTVPVFCEALARAWEFSPEAVAAAKAYLGSMGRLLNEGCLEQIPEILDGDAPHQQRGCDAQAWGVTEALRVWKLLARRCFRPARGV